ncbi:F-gD [Chelonid alphaherpesvirus 5]|uniref:F-gD n=1 Tax=Chelonid alphaherpesvirus 5 TaxID=702736 RepID=V5NYN1_9ALPH|nr:F-gD [Chelonid alphaherpesvirus 5]AHA93303.1 F-gD [Chelonid alphaherpesvirus 5]
MWYPLMYVFLAVARPLAAVILSGNDFSLNLRSGVSQVCRRSTCSLKASLIIHEAALAHPSSVSIYVGYEKRTGCRVPLVSTLLSDCSPGAGNQHRPCGHMTLAKIPRFDLTFNGLEATFSIYNATKDDSGTYKTVVVMDEKQHTFGVTLTVANSNVSPSDRKPLKDLPCDDGKTLTTTKTPVSKAPTPASPKGTIVLIFFLFSLSVAIAFLLGVYIKRLGVCGRIKNILEYRRATHLIDATCEPEIDHLPPEKQAYVILPPESNV